MRKAVFVFAGICAAAATASAQEVDPNQWQPLTSPIVDAGTFNWSTKRWVTQPQANRLRALTTKIYDNTCTYTGGNTYSEVPLCVTFFDEGEIPATSSPGAPAGATDDNLISEFEIAYCTRQPTGVIDIKVGFYEAWGGCLVGLGGAPYPAPLSGQANGYFDFGAAAGFPLPGDPAPGGSYQCMKVNIVLGNAAFCMQSEGNGVYDNTAQLDKFAWSFESNTQPYGGAGAGVTLIRAGEPSLSPAHGCTYNVPCGSDPSPWVQVQPIGSPCGHGWGTEDHWWMNIDGDAWGDTINSGTVCPGSPGAGSTCYWFLGYPTNVFASFWLELGSAGPCSGCNGSPIPYCTPGTTTNGCAATISMAGAPSVSNAAPCNINAANVEGGKSGLIFYGLQASIQPWGTGTSFLCIKAPTQRLAAQSTGGTTGQCNGSLSSNINAFWAANPGALGQPLFVGQNVFFQGWFRDPPAPKTTNLTNALQVTLCP
jgi:hypothetical protein